MADILELEQEVMELREVVGLLLEHVHNINVALAKPTKDWQYGRIDEVWKRYLEKKRAAVKVAALSEVQGLRR